MKFPELDASAYNFSDEFFSKEFEEILSKIIACYRHMLSDNIVLPDNENKIRDSLLGGYLKNTPIKKQYGLTDYLFDPELPENTGRIDIRVMPLNPFIDDKAYYVIECKRLNSTNQNGKTGLNGEYISSGICRFVSEKYTSFYDVNGMIGFIVEALRIADNVESINKLLGSSFTEANATRLLQAKSILADFDYSYYSTHKTENGEVTIYHLMFDFSQNIITP